MSGQAPMDLDAYLARIGYSGPRTPTLETFFGVHLAHATHIPFENLDILLGRPIRIDLDSVQAKLVRGRRGGYCFEQNTLLKAALETLGFSVTALGARVRYRTTQIQPHTHMLLRVDLEGGPWLADVGYGSAGLLQPLPLEPGAPVRQFAWSYRLVNEGDVRVLQWQQGGQWLDLYAFTLEPQHVADFEMANHYTSTHPGSRFVRTPTAQRVTPEARYVLRDRELTVLTAAGIQTRAVADEEVVPLLAELFDLQLPPETRAFPAASQPDR